MLVEQLIKRHEGLKYFCYKCSSGKRTIGYGRNIDISGGQGISILEAEFMLDNDIDRIQKRLSVNLPMYESLNEVRQAVLVSMAFNLGIAGLLGFKRMLAAVNYGDFNVAADEMIDSRWAMQVRNRAFELSQMMRTGNAELSKRI